MPRNYDPILIVCDDPEGASFVLFDPRDRYVYEDIILCRDLHRLYDRFPIRLTVTNIRKFRPPSGNCVFHPASHSSHQTLHYSARARLLATSFFKKHMCVNAFMIPRLKTKPLSFEDEEWRRWIREEDSDPSTVQSSPSSSPSTVSSVSSSSVLMVSLAE